MRARRAALARAADRARARRQAHPPSASCAARHVQEDRAQRLRSPRVAPKYRLRPTDQQTTRNSATPVSLGIYALTAGTE